MLYNVGNMAVWACCISASFGWDERAVPIILVFMMSSFLIIAGDATCSDFEYRIRSVFLIFVTLVCFSGTVASGGYLLSVDGLGRGRLFMKTLI